MEHQNYGTNNTEDFDLSVPTYGLANGAGNDLNGYNLIDPNHREPIVPYNNMEMLGVDPQELVPTLSPKTVTTL